MPNFEWLTLEKVRFSQSKWRAWQWEQITDSMPKLLYCISASKNGCPAGG